MPARTRASRRALVTLAATALGLTAPLLALPAGSAYAAGSGERVTTTSVQISANVAFDMSADRQRADIATVTSMSDVVGWQEITTRAQQEAIRSQKGWATYWPGGFARGQLSMASTNSNPISYRKAKWQRVEVGKRWTSPEFEDVCRERYVSWVILRDRATGVKVARWNIHFVPGAWTDGGTGPQKRQRASLQKAWRKQARVVSEVVTDLGRRAHVVTGGGDVNRSRHAFLGDQVTYDTDMTRLDYMTHVGNQRVARTDWSFVDLNSDHHAARAVYDLSRWRPRR